MVTAFYVDSPSVYDSTSMRIAMLYSPPTDCIYQYTRHLMARLSKNASAIVEALRANKDIARAWTVLHLEVVKLQREYVEISQLFDGAANDHLHADSRTCAAFSAFRAAASSVQESVHQHSHTNTTPECQISLCLRLCEVAESTLSSVRSLVVQRVEESVAISSSSAHPPVVVARL